MNDKKLRVFVNVSFAVFSIFLALSLGAIIITVLGFNSLNAYHALWSGAFGSVHSFSETLVHATPLLFTAVSYSTAQKCGLINLGVEGQLYIGAIAGAFVGARFGFLPSGLHIFFVMACAFFSGAIWGSIAGILKVRFGASEMITTIMLNFVAFEFMNFVTTNEPFRDTSLGASPRMLPVVDSVRLLKLAPQTRLHVGFVFALLAIFSYYIFIWKTTKGYEMRVAGLNVNAGHYAGIKINKNIVLALFISGGFAGLGGIVNVIGLQPFLTEGFSNNFGFNGIAVALLGGGDPIGILIMSIFYGGLNAGGIRMQVITQVPVAVIRMIQGMIIVFAVTPGLFLFFYKAGKSLFLPKNGSDTNV